MFIIEESYRELEKALHAKSNPDEQKMIWRKINTCLREITPIDSWAEMRKKIEIEYSGDPVQLPADMVGIDLVWDDDNEIQFFDRNRYSAETTEYAYRYFTYPKNDIMATVNDAVFQQDSTTFVSDDLLALGLETDNEWFYVNTSPQMYQISSNSDNIYTFSPAYRGVGNVRNAQIIVRPPQTMLLDLVGHQNVAVSTSTIDVHYWAYPTELRDVTDTVPLPTSTLLTLMVLNRMPEAKKRHPVSHKQVKEARDEALTMNPDKPCPRVLRGIQGTKVDFRRPPYRGMGVYQENTVLSNLRREINA